MKGSAKSPSSGQATTDSAKGGSTLSDEAVKNVVSDHADMRGGGSKKSY